MASKHMGCHGDNLPLALGVPRLQDGSKIILPTQITEGSFSGAQMLRTFIFIRKFGIECM